jgi:hypothetical protein
MRRFKQRRSKGEDGRGSESTIGDVGRGMYGPDPDTDRPVSRFERTRRSARERKK